MFAEPSVYPPQSLSETRPSASLGRVACFSILAEAEPGVLPRVLELFAKRNLVPQRWHSDRVGPGGRELAIDLQVAGLTVELTDYIARCLRQMHYVDSVLTSEKVPAERRREKVWA